MTTNDNTNDNNDLTVLVSMRGLVHFCAKLVDEIGVGVGMGPGDRMKFSLSAAVIAAKQWDDIVQEAEENNVNGDTLAIYDGDDDDYDDPDYSADYATTETL